MLFYNSYYSFRSQATPTPSHVCQVTHKRPFFEGPLLGFPCGGLYCMYMYRMHGMV